MSWKTWALPVWIVALAGCVAPVRQDVDQWICNRAGQLIDPLPAAAAPKDASSDGAAGASKPRPVTTTATTLEKRLQVPRGLPGGRVPPIMLPEGPTPEAIQKYLPALPPLGPEPVPVAGSEGKPLSLADLQRLARANSPLLRQAASDVKAAHGAAVQAGLYPNPQLGVALNGAGPGGGPYIGANGAQTIKTMGKLNLARAAAEMDVKNAEIAYRKAEVDLMTQVRSSYFAVLVAQESMRAHRALVALTDELYKVMVAQLKGGEVAVYEPMQIGVLAGQARANLLMARNSYQLAWKQLVAALGLPALPAAELEGRADMPLPHFDYDRTLARVLAYHTDVQAAAVGLQKARYRVRSAEVAPVPDVTFYGQLQQDATLFLSPVSGPNRIIWNGIGTNLTVPLFDRNQGNVRDAQAALLRATEEPHRVRADLTGRFAEAFRRYDENRVLLERYRTSILPKQVQAFRASVKRHYGEGDVKVAYTDLVQAEQNLVASVGSYLSVLAAEWQAVVDVAGYLQSDDLFQLADGTHAAAIPDLEQLLQLPCCHPCTPLPPAAFTRHNVAWTPSSYTLGLEERPAPPAAPRAAFGPVLAPPETHR